jgi:uncharacterized protein (DUF2147 family)
MEYSAMKFRSAFALAILFAATTVARADSEPTAAGFWEAQDDDGHPTAWFLFTDKDDVYSARLVKGFKVPGDDKPPQKICTKCPGDKKGAHIMGLTLFWGMKRDGLSYTEGSVLDPRDGSVYHAKMDLSEDGKELSVRGYIGIPMLGKTQVWHRLPDDALKTEDIPKEVLANGEESPGDKADKPKHASGDKAKHKKTAKAKAAKPEAPDGDANADGDKTPQ